MVKPDHERVRVLLTDTIVLLCRNGLNFKNNLTVQGLIAVTTDDCDVFVVQISDVMSTDANIAPVDVPRKRRSEHTSSHGSSNSLTENNASVKVEILPLNNDEISSALTIDSVDKVNNSLNNIESKNIVQNVTQVHSEKSDCEAQSTNIMPETSSEITPWSVKEEEEEEGGDDDDVIFVENAVTESAVVSQCVNTVGLYDNQNQARASMVGNIKKRRLPQTRYAAEDDVNDESYETEQNRTSEYDNKYSATASYTTGDNLKYETDTYDDQRAHDVEDGEFVEMGEDGSAFSGRYSDANFSEHLGTEQFHSTDQRFANSSRKRFRSANYLNSGDSLLAEPQYPNVAEQSSSSYVESTDNVAEWTGGADDGWGSPGKRIVAVKPSPGRPRAGQVRALNPGHFTVQSKERHTAALNRKNFPCLFCDKKYSRQNRLLEHTTISHQTDLFGRPQSEVECVKRREAYQRQLARNRKTRAMMRRRARGAPVGESKRVATRQTSANFNKCFWSEKTRNSYRSDNLEDSQSFVYQSLTSAAHVSVDIQSPQCHSLKSADRVNQNRRMNINMTMELPFKNVESETGVESVKIERS